MDGLRGRLEERLHALAAARPDLDRGIALQQTLLGRQIDLLDVIRTGGLPALALPPGYLAAKLKRGVPALHGEPIPLPSRVLALAAREFCDHLAHAGAAGAANEVARVLDSGALDAGALVSACFGRNQRRVRAMSAAQSVSPDVAWLVAELAAAPFAHLLQLRLLGPEHPALREALRGWDRGLCPACGSWPAIVEVTGGPPVLRCSFCAAGWSLSSYRCPYCGNDAESFVTAAPDPEAPGRRILACGACGGYVKALDLSAPTTFPLVAIEDLASMDLDMLAIERKYMRPALPKI